MLMQFKLFPMQSFKLNPYLHHEVNIVSNEVNRNKIFIRKMWELWSKTYNSGAKKINFKGKYIIDETGEVCIKKEKKVVAK